MSRIACFIDGFNLYHALQENPQYRKYKWLNISAFVRCFILPKDDITNIFFFTALTMWNPDKVARHQNYIRALESTDVNIVYGKFKAKDRLCRLCKRRYSTFEEKQTDVNIAVKLFQAAIDDLYDVALIFSADSDLIPAIEGIKSNFPGKTIVVVIPIGRSSESLKNVAHFHKKIKERQLKTSQFPDDLDLGEGLILHRPATWV